MTRIVALDTTTNTGSMALWQDGEIIDHVLIPAPDGYNAILFPALQAMLQNHGLRPEEIDRWAAASGPGSFTGIRVGLTIVKGLAEAFGKSAHGISNLRALAWHGALPMRAPMLDARRGDVYCAVYDCNLNEIEPEMVTPLDRWLTLAPRESEFLIQNQELFAAALLGRCTRLVGDLAEAVAHLAAKEPATDPVAIEANYVRRSDAELSLKV